jgi:hypothetical protein
MKRPVSLVLAFALAGAASAADLTKVDRRVVNEPAYKSKAPKYALLVIGPEARDRVWLVKDGEVLHVLAEKTFTLSPTKDRTTDEERDFELSKLPLNGRTHANLRLRIVPLRRWMIGDYANRPELKAAIEKEPNAEALSLAIEAELPHLKSTGRVEVFAGCLDLNGALLLASKPTEAPIVHVGGPLEVTIQTKRPTLLRGRPNQVEAVVGSRGVGAGTFAVLGYEGAIPDGIRPRLAITFPPRNPGEKPPKQRYELPDRC